MKDIPDFEALLKIESPNALIERLDELADEIAGENGEKLSSIVAALKIQAEGRRWIINELRETLDQLRMDLQRMPMGVNLQPRLYLRYLFQ